MKKNLESLKNEMFNLSENQSIAATGGGYWSYLIGKISLTVKKVNPSNPNSGFFVTDDNGKTLYYPYPASQQPKP